MLQIKTSEDLSKLIISNKTVETIYIELKAVLNSQKKDWYIETACDLCQFANSWGGYLLFGISERRNPINGLVTAGDIVGVDNAEDIRKKINTTVRDWIYPSNIDFETFFIEYQNKIVVAVIVQPNFMGLSFVKNSKDNGFIVPYRTEYGKKYMTPEMITERLSLNRSVQIKLNRYFPQRNELSVITPVYKERFDPELCHSDNPFKVCEVHPIIHGSSIKLCEVNFDSILISYKNCKLTIPFSLIKDVWEKSLNLIGIAFLGTIIINDEDSVSNLRMAVGHLNIV